MQLHFIEKKSTASNVTSDFCRTSPVHLQSGGFSVSVEEPLWWMKDSSTLMQFQIFIFCSTVAVIHFVLKRLRIPKFPCQLITGLIFACSWKQWDEQKFELFPVESEDALGLFACFGHILYLFLSAVKIDVITIMKTDRKALLIGIPTILLTLIFGFIVQKPLRRGLTEDQIRLIPIMICFHSLTSFPVIASVMAELKMVNSELGRLGISSALVIDLLSLSMIITSGQIKRFREYPNEAYFELGALILEVFFISCVFRPAMRWIVKQTPDGKLVRQSFVQFVVLLVLLCCIISSFTGQSPLTGPYLLGFAVPDGPPLAATLVERIESLVSEVFMPIMVVTCALRADLSPITAASDGAFARFNVVILCVMLVFKLISCLVFSLLCKMRFKEALTLSLIISCKGVVELVIYTIVTDRHGISGKAFGYLALIILTVSTFMPMAVRFLHDDPSRKYAGNSQNRNIMHLNSNAEFRVLACLHRDDNVYGVVHLLNVSCPTPEHRLSVYVFHLIELLGRTTPIFICHKLHNKNLNTTSFSENIVRSFEHFESDNSGAVSVECFTAVSPSKFMQDDIYTLALDKATSFIILPFHRTWTADGLIDEDNNLVKTLNASMLERAPCSVGIFVDRGHFGRTVAMASSGKPYIYSVCIIFLGGRDDREAISYGTRMARDPRVELTVLRLRSAGGEEEDGSKNWENMLDSEVLRHFKLNCVGNRAATYMEEVTGDVAQTARRVTKMADEYDLLIVGRRHGLECAQTADLSEWNEFPELGILGDLIVSTDPKNRASVLVIQQQISNDPS